ncbi:MAG TPA: hypothetical protein VKR55_09545 [Bradyrhizobium sp.]|uniref:hypothetical protein n=1 Tax=Bradyrhizobium sp. TaxID=376 RepID=UPI002CC78DA3|nr:hypothetical protein [Bradyrhizobium sp.]HLZ02379.1 hypothetical protein [Bradyrhizobium sp.]
MTEALTEPFAPTTARPEFAWFSNGIPEVPRINGRDGLPVQTVPCSADPIFGQASPIMDQRPVAAHARRSDGLRDISFPRQSRDHRGRRELMIKHVALMLRKC